MKRSVTNKSNRDIKIYTNIPASTRRLVNKKKVSSYQDDIEDKFARMCLAPKVVNDEAPSAKRTPLQTIEKNLSKMCLTPPEINVSQAVVDKASSANKPKPPHKKRSPKKSSPQGVVTGKNKTTFKEYKHGYAPVVPSCLYGYLQEAAYFIKFLETHKDDIYAQLSLKGLEVAIGKLAFVYKDFLPKDWKYDRATAHTWKEVPYFC